MEGQKNGQRQCGIRVGGVSTPIPFVGSGHTPPFRTLAGRLRLSEFELETGSLVIRWLI